MVTYRKQTLGTGGSCEAARVPLTALKPALAAPAMEVFRAADRVVQQGRRIVFDTGICGALEWGVPEDDPNSNTRIYPDRTTWRERGRTRFDQTPGTKLVISGTYLPAGETQRAATAGEGAPAWRADGRHGRVRITATWTSGYGGTAESTKVLTMAHSTLQYGGTDHSAGAVFRDMRELDRVDLMPPGFLTNAATQRLYSSGCPTVDIVVETQGSPRILDLRIHEEPCSFANEDGDDATRWTQTCYANTPDAPHVLPRFPKYRNSPTDPRDGTLQILRTVAAQRQRLGPMLLQWHAFHPHYQTWDADFTPFTTSSTSFVGVPDPTLTAWSAAAPGFSVSCGGYARDWITSGYFVFRDRTAVIPVVLRVYGRATVSGSGIVRVQTSLCSYVDVTLPVAGSPSWHTAFGWLEVGINPDQESHAMIFARQTLGGLRAVEVEAVTLQRCGATPAA